MKEYFSNFKIRKICAKLSNIIHTYAIKLIINVITQWGTDVACEAYLRHNEREAVKNGNEYRKKKSPERV